MFLQVCVCPQGGGVCLSACWDARHPPQDQADTPPGPGRHPTPTGPGRPPLGPGRPPQEADSSIPSTSGQYASYWNAFLFNECCRNPLGQTTLPPPSPHGHCSGRYASYWNAFLLPPANEVWGKVMFLQVSVILFPGGYLVQRGGGAWSLGGYLVPGQCLVPGGLQAHNPGGNWGGSGPDPQSRGKLRGSGPGPQPRGKLKGIWSRPTPKGQVEGDLAQAHTQGEEVEGIWSRPTPKGEVEGELTSPPPHPPTATAEGGTHPTGMHSCWMNVHKGKIIPQLRWAFQGTLLLRRRALQT